MVDFTATSGIFNSACKSGKIFLSLVSVNLQKCSKRSMPECPIQQNLADCMALSISPDRVYGKDTLNLSAIDAAVKSGWLYKITISEEHRMNYLDTKSLVNAARQMGGFEGLKLVWALHPNAFTPHHKRTTARKLKDVRQEDLDAARKMLHYMLELRDLLPSSTDTVGVESNRLVAMEE